LPISNTIRFCIVDSYEFWPVFYTKEKLKNTNYLLIIASSKTNDSISIYAIFRCWEINFYLRYHNDVDNCNSSTRPAGHECIVEGPTAGNTGNCDADIFQLYQKLVAHSIFTICLCRAPVGILVSRNIWYKQVNA